MGPSATETDVKHFAVAVNRADLQNMIIYKD